MLNIIRDFFRHPSSYRTDPRGFALNQIGHVAIVGALPVALGVPVPVVLAVFAAWEFAQWRRYEAETFDGFEDFAFVAGGALAAFAKSWGVLAVLAVLAVTALHLIAGTVRRYDDRHLSDTNCGATGRL